MNLRPYLKYLTTVFVVVIIGLLMFFAYKQAVKKFEVVTNPVNGNQAQNGNGDDNGVVVEPTADEEALLSNLKLPEGFNISVFAKQLGKVRVMAFDSNGTMYVSITDQGKVMVLQDKNKDGKADLNLAILSGLNQPHGLTVFCPIDFPSCYLYVAETDSVSRWELDIDNFKLGPREKLFDLPGGGGHYTRTIKLINYEGEVKLLTSIGSSCNVCKEADSNRATIMISDNDGENLRKFATGLRNSVFMTQDTRSGRIYATEMGRDSLGDEVPPEEINVIEFGKFYGWPYCYDDNILDRSFSTSKEADDACASATSPFVKMQAHSAPLGIALIENSVFGDKLNNNLLVAFHGSWNRTVPTGYKVISIPVDENGNAGQPIDFISGWLTNDGTVVDRPVDIKTWDNVMYITGDKEGIVYRVTYSSQ